MSQFKGTYDVNQTDEAKLERNAAPPMPGRGMLMQRGSGMKGMGERSMDPRFEAVRGRMMEFQRLLQEKEAAGYDVKAFKEMSQRLSTAIREGDVEEAAKKISEAMERLKTLKK